MFISPGFSLPRWWKVRGQWSYAAFQDRLGNFGGSVTPCGKLQRVRRTRTGRRVQALRTSTYPRGTWRMTCLVIARKENQESRGCQNAWRTVVHIQPKEKKYQGSVVAKNCGLPVGENMRLSIKHKDNRRCGSQETFFCRWREERNLRAYLGNEKPKAPFQASRKKKGEKRRQRHQR